MSDPYQPTPPPEPVTPAQYAAPAQPAMPPMDTPIGTPPPDGTPFVAAFPNADEASVQAAEQRAADSPDTEGVVVNPGPQLSDTAPDQNTEPAMPPPPVNP